MVSELFHSTSLNHYELDDFWKESPTEDCFEMYETSIRHIEVFHSVSSHACVRKLNVDSL